MTTWICEGWNRARNTVAYWLMRFTLNCIATREYQQFITGAIRYGMVSAAKDSEEDQ